MQSCRIFFAGHLGGNKEKSNNPSKLKPIAYPLVSVEASYKERKVVYSRINNSTD